jgi:S1-C subfamily serine protease
LLLAGIALALHPATPRAQTLSAEELVSGVVRLKTFINPDGRTTETLGRERKGSGIVIAADGLILTIGYLMVEAHSAEVTTNDGRTVPADLVGYDYDTGFGLLKAAQPLKVRPMALGRSGDLAVGEKVLVASGGGVDMLGSAAVVSKREFAGYWEYLLDEAIFTSPPHPAWSGAALVNREGKLVGVGSLIVSDSPGKGGRMPGNMFVPIDRLPPILGELIANGRVSDKAKPWIGLNTDEADGRLVVRRVTPGGPAEKSGVEPGDRIVAVAGAAPKDLADLYRRIWALGGAGVTVPLEIERDGEKQRIDIKSINRMSHLRMRSTF